MADPIAELELYIIRHGQSRSNAGENVPDPGLTARGHHQAELLGEYFARLPLDHIVASGLRRAVETASEVAKRQPDGGAKQVEVCKLFCECGTGIEDPDRPIAQVAEEFPLAVPAKGETWESSAILHTYPEPPEARTARAKQALAWLREQFHEGEKVMLVAHGTFNSWLMDICLGITRNGNFAPEFTNTSITKVVFYKKGYERYGCPVNLICQNDHSHLWAEYPEILLNLG